jgi:hypothetical protein
MNREFPWFKSAALASAGWLVSGAVHEAGHALAAKMAGLKVVEFQPWAFLGRLHVRYTGVTTDAWWASIHISGMLFAVLIGILGAVVVTFITRKWVRAGLAVWFFVPIMCQCLAWLAVPIATMLGTTAAGDDVTKFMLRTAWSPWVVLVIGLALAVLCGSVLRWSYMTIKAYKTPAHVQLKAARCASSCVR